MTHAIMMYSFIRLYVINDEKRKKKYKKKHTKKQKKSKKKTKKNKKKKNTNSAKAGSKAPVAKKRMGVNESSRLVNYHKASSGVL
jgi:hypothetical protein